MHLYLQHEIKYFKLYLVGIISGGNYTLWDTLLHEINKCISTGIVYLLRFILGGIIPGGNCTWWDCIPGERHPFVVPESESAWKGNDDHPDQAKMCKGAQTSISCRRQTNKRALYVVWNFP